MIQRVVITGGAGFLGSHLIDRLLEHDVEVLCFDNYVTGSPQNLAHRVDWPSLQLYRQDVTEPLDVSGAVDAVLHFASLASPVDYAKYPIATLDVGTLGTQQALRLAVAKRARFLLASTSEVYGDPLVHPQPESYWGNVNPIGARSMYDESKRAAEAYVMAYRRAHGLQTSIARIFNTYGPRIRRDDGRAVPQFISQALAGEPVTVYGDGSQTRSLCYVDDLVVGVYRLLESDYAPPVNLGNPEEVTIRHLADAVIRCCSSKSKIAFRQLPEDDPRRRRPDITTARRVLGWEPSVPLEEGLNRTVEWWRANRLIEPGTTQADPLPVS